jgi:hypothetical protein
MVCAAYAAIPVQAQVAQTPPQSGSSSATDSTSPGAPSAVPFFVSNSQLVPGWSFSLAPYGWLASVNARISARIPGGDVVTTDVHVPFEDLLRDLRFGVLLAGEARYDRFSILTDVMYLNLGLGLSAARLTSVTGPGERINIPVGLQASASAGIGTTVWTLAGGYTLAAGEWGNIDAIAGARLLAVDFSTSYSLSLTAPIIPGLSKSGSFGVNVADWDAIVGARGRFDIPNSNFFVPFYFDVGTGDLPLTWQAFTGLGYHTSWADYSLGYRYLDFQTSGSSPVKNLSMGGPMIAATFHF